MKLCAKCNTSYGEGQTFCYTCGAYVKTQKQTQSIDAPHTIEPSKDQPTSLGREPSSYDTKESPSAGNFSYKESEASEPTPGEMPDQDPDPSMYQGQYSKPMAYPRATPQLGGNRRMVGLAALVAGPLGLHYFMMNKKGRGILFLAMTVLALLADPVLGISLFYVAYIPGMIGILQGIRILCLTDEQFAEIYYNIPPKDYYQPQQNSWMNYR